MPNDNGLKQNIIFILLITLLAVCFYNMRQISVFEKRTEIKIERARDFAAKLASQKLYHEAAAHIEKYLSDNLVAPEEVESTSIYLADLYFEHIHDYEKAMAAYLKVLFKFPATKYKNDLERRVIDCKDRLGRRLEAANDLETINNRGAASKKTPAEAGSPAATDENSIVVAKIGETSVTMTDYLNELDSLFKQSQMDLSNPENRRKLLKDVIARKVLLKLANSKRFDTDAQILKKVNSAKEQIMIEKLLNEEVFSKTEVDEMSLKLYYDAHKNEMRTPDKYKFDYLVLNDSTEAVSIASNNDSAKFSSYASLQTPFAPLGEIAAAAEIDLSEATAEIAAAVPGEIIRKAIKRVDGSFAVLKLTNFIKGDILPFESVKNDILSRLTAQKRENDLQNYIMKNFAELNVVIFDEVFKRENVKEK